MTRVLKEVRGKRISKDKRKGLHQEDENTLFSFEGITLKFGDDSKEVPPVPIPNTEVKLFYVEDTWRATARENR